MGKEFINLTVELGIKKYHLTNRQKSSESLKLCKSLKYNGK